MPTDGFTPDPPPRDLKTLFVAALMFRRSAMLSAASSAVAIGGALVSYLGHLALGGGLILLACMLLVIARAYSKRARWLSGFR